MLSRILLKVSSYFQVKLSPLYFHQQCVFLKTKKLAIATTTPVKPVKPVKPIKAKKLKQTEEVVEVAKRSTRARPLLNATAAVTNLANTDRTVIVSNSNPANLQATNTTRSNPKPVQIVQPIQSSSSVPKNRSPTKSARQSPNKAATSERTMYLTEYEDGLVENFSFSK